MDDREGIGAAGPASIDPGEDFEIVDFAIKHGMSIDQARQLMASAANRRAALDAIALKRG